MAGKLGQKIYRSKAWAVVRRVVFERDGYRCTMCGVPGRLECDHIEPIEKGGDWFALDNLRTLCRSCHVRVSRQESLDRSGHRSNPLREALKEMAHA